MSLPLGTPSVNSLHGSSVNIGVDKPCSDSTASWGNTAAPLRLEIGGHKRGGARRAPRNIDHTELLGVPLYKPRNAGERSYDYEEKYPQDPAGEEAGGGARVWKVYLDEAESYDDDMVKGFQDTINTLLVLAALFSAVVTTFAVETSQLLRTDYAQLTVLLLLEQIQLTRAAGNATAIAAVLPSSLNLTLLNPSYSASDVWVNALFFTSLALSLATALLSVLAKQWIQAYTSLTSGTAKDRSLIRHFRFQGLLKWKLPELIGILPLLLHTALALFLSGLAVFVYSLHKPMSWIVVSITAASFAFYLGTLFLPVLWLECPYRIALLYRPMGYIIFLLQSVRFFFRRVFKPSRKSTPPPQPAFKSLKVAELEIFSRSRSYDAAELALDCIAWLHDLTPNATVRRVATQALVGLDILEINPVQTARQLLSLSKSTMVNTAFQGLYDHPDIPPFADLWHSQDAVWARAVHWFINVGGYIALDRNSRKAQYYEHLLSVFLRSARENRPNLLAQALDWGVDIDTCTTGKTALQVASSEGHVEVVRILLEKGADVNILNRDGSALHMACEDDRAEIAALLIGRGADVDIQAGLYGTALRSACVKGHLNVVRILTDSGADPNLQGRGSLKDGAPLAAASGQGHFEIVKHLLSHGADVNVYDDFYDGTALTAASEGGNINTVTLLLDMGGVSDSDEKRGKYNSALLRACQRGQFSIVRLLLERGGDPHAIFSADEGWSGSLVQAARAYNQPMIVGLLRGYGVRDDMDGGFGGLS